MATSSPAKAWVLSPDRCFDSDPAQRQIAQTLYSSVKDLPLICPHGHVPPALLSNPEANFGSPADLFIIPDHYVFRMLYSQGVPLEELGVPRQDGGPVESDHRKIWQRFADNFHLFRATPTGLWLADELINLFGISEKLTSESAQRIYDQIETRLADASFRPRALFERFNIEVLCTTDFATDSLAEHQSLLAEGFSKVRPTFRPDGVINIDTLNWRANIDKLSELSAIDIVDYNSFIKALESRRAFFKSLGATATDHSAPSPASERISEGEAQAIFSRALRGETSANDAARFTAHMLNEMARMSVEDGLVMQLHVGSRRNHNSELFARFGADKGADIPLQTEWTRNLHPLLNAYGNDPRFRLILFTLDESSYSRELAPLAGHYPAVLLGPPWWFYDSILGMQRYLDLVIETTGIYNTAGFNDDTRAFASIPARHDVWRRVTSNWLAGQVVRGIIDEEEGQEMAHEFAYGLAKRAYRLGQ
jgi:glucuronate isomerase